MQDARIAALHRYPVKGLSPEPLARVELSAGDYFAGDRLFAVENGPSGFEPAAPVHQPKIKFLMLMRNEALARLTTRYEDATRTLVVEREGREVARGAVDTDTGRKAIEDFLAGHLPPDDLRGPPKLLAAPHGFRFTDSAKGHVSILNLASVAAIEDWVGATVDPLRFRANVHVSGWPAFAELDLVGREFAFASGLRLSAVARIDRCAATNVDPRTGIRDMLIPKLLMQRLGHPDCGVYCRVANGGAMAVGDIIRVAEGATAATLPF